MNIFAVDYNPIAAARMHANKHVIKQILESCQLLCSTMRIHGIQYGYKITHKNHPCRLWVEKSRSNFEWLKQLGIALGDEYTYRYGKVHKSQSIMYSSYCPSSILDKGLTPFALAIPDDCKLNDPVQSYRKYYREYKRHLLVYKVRQPPEWVSDLAIYKEL